MATDIYNRAWIIENSVAVISTYYEGITLRQLYYRLVSKGMTNDVQHYKRVVAGLTSARWDGTVEMTSFVDRERQVSGLTSADTKNVATEIDYGKQQIKSWMSHYRLERWSNQDNFVEVWIEKKALQGVFESPCFNMDVAVCPCKGYPSLTFLNDAKERFNEAQERGQNVTILYFGDFDPSGSDIPRSIEENLRRMDCDITVDRIGLNPDLIKELSLPSVPPKKTDTRSASWDGEGAVELDAVEPNMLKDICKEAIKTYFDEDKYSELKELEEKEKETYKEALKEFVENFDEDD